MHYLEVFQNVTRLEDRYRALIRGLDPDPVRVAELGEKLQAAFLRVTGEVRYLRRFAPSSHNQLVEDFKVYLNQLSEIHHRNNQWIAVYVDFCRPADDQRWTRRKNGYGPKALDGQLAQYLWRVMEEKDASSGLSGREKKIARLKAALNREPLNSVRWRLCYRELSKAIYDYLIFILIEGKYDIKNLFVVTLYNALLRRSPTNTPPAGLIADCLRGYRKDASVHLEHLQQTARNLLVLPYRAAVRNYQKYKLLKVTAGVIVFLFLAGGLRMTGIDARLWSGTVFAVKKMFKLDPQSLLRKEYEKFFQNQIKSFDRKAVEQKIRQNLKQFLAVEIHNSSGRYMFFAERILKDFFLGLSDREFNIHIKQEVLDAAARLDPDIARPLYHMIILYGQRVIHETPLKEEMLDLRRAFVKYNVFPFMFLILYDEAPHLFLFPEPMVFSYILSDQAMTKLGMDPDDYRPYIELPVVGFVVPGRTYPFKDREGYFEGEFAVIFDFLTDNREWTAHHEIGHVVDHIRETYEKIPAPENVELNAMMYPMIFSEGRKDYINERLVGRLRHPKIHDYYTQAAKGILNGILLYRRGDKPSVTKQLITNRFEKEKIDSIQKLVNAMTGPAIRRMTLEMFRHPQDYLYTTGPGQYLSVMTNNGEITAGGHGIAQRGFVVGNGWGSGLNLKGPRFIRDAVGKNDNSDMPFDLMAFIKSVIRVAIFHREGLANASRVEAIAASVLVFILFESTVIALHFIGRPIRRRKFYGRSLPEMVDAIYHHHPWSDGLSYGLQLNERRLLKEVFAAEGEFSPSLENQVISFKATADERARMLFDIGLCLAVFNPQKALIKNKAHDLLFYLPFIGPAAARSKWLFKVQKHFHDRERYNAALVALAGNIDTRDLPSEVVSRFRAVVEEFSPEKQRGNIAGEDEAYLKELEKLIDEELHEQQRAARLKEKWIVDRRRNMTGMGSEFDRLAKYYPGDDIRRIDWQATARCAGRDIFIRKYAEPHTVNIALLMDMRFLDREKARKKWARDFARIVHALGRGQVIGQLSFILKDGSVTEFTVHIIPSMNRSRSARLIFGRIKEKYTCAQQQAGRIDFSSLNFYTQEENRRFIRQAALTDFAGERHSLRRSRISSKGMNIFVIGDTIIRHGELESMIPEGSQLIRWEHVLAG